MDLAHIDHEKKDYYYYPNQNTKVEVIFRTREDGKIEKVTRTYYLSIYPPSLAEKVRDRQNWSKFGQAANNTNNKSVTSFGDEVEMEILIQQPKKKKSLQEQQPQDPSYKEINKVFYIDKTVQTEKKVNNEEVVKEEHTPTKVVEQPNDTDVIKPRKSLVKCRHCGDSSHWSIKCPIQQKKLEDIEAKNRKETKQKEG